MERAEALGRDVYEYVKQIDYDQVWGAVGGGVELPWRALLVILQSSTAQLASIAMVYALKPTILLPLRMCTFRPQYFESMRGAPRDGGVTKQYYDFSLNSAKAAQTKLREFLALMPAEQREAAETQLASMPF